MLEITFRKAISPDGLEAIAEGDYVVDRKNSNFYLPDVEIPRFKRKVFADENKMKNTNKLSKANCIIFNPFSAFYKHEDTTVISYDENYRIETSKFLEHAKVLGNYGYVDDKTIKKIELLSKTNPYIYSSYSDYKSFTTELSDLANYYVGYEYTEYPFIQSEELTEAYQANPNIKFYTQRSVQKCLSDAGIIVDVDKYKELCKLIDTDDSDNVVLAMEIMANSNYAKSIIYIFMLLIKRGKVMAELGNTDHVNFKHMLHYFNLGNQDLNENFDEGDVETIFRTLKEHGQFTRANANMFLNFYNNEKADIIHRGASTNNGLALNKNAEIDEIDDHHEIVTDDVKII